MSLDETNLSATEIYKLTTQETRINSESARQYQYQTGYALFNLTSGTQTINLPPLILKRDGTTTHRFYPPPFTLAVKALPLYLPATVPVGSLSLATEKSYQFNITDRLTSTNIKLSGKHVQPSLIPDIMRQLSSTDSLQTYPATHKEIQTKEPIGLVTKLHYTLPLKLTNQGIHTLEPIRLLNFDPEHGILHTAEYTLPHFVSFNIWVTLFLLLIMSLLSLFVIHKFYRFIHFKIRRYRYYRLALKQLAIAKDKQSIRSALKLVSQAEGWGLNITPQTWLKQFAPKSTTNKLRDPLNQLFYTGLEQTDIATLTHSLMQSIKARHCLIF